MNPTPHESPLTGAITHEADRLGNDLFSFLSGVPVGQRGTALDRVLAKVFQDPNTTTESVLMSFWRFRVLGKQVFPRP